VGIGVSIFLFAIGAILAFAVNVNTRGVNINTVGVILMIVGAVGALLSLAFWSSMSPWGGTRRETIIEDDVIHDVHHHH